MSPVENAKSLLTGLPALVQFRKYLVSAYSVPGFVHCYVVVSGTQEVFSTVFVQWEDACSVSDGILSSSGRWELPFER